MHRYLVATLLVLSMTCGLRAETAGPEHVVRSLYQKILDYEKAHNRQYLKTVHDLSENKAVFTPSFYHTLCAGLELFSDGYQPFLDFNPMTYRQGTLMSGYKIVGSQVSGSTCEVTVDITGPGITGRANDNKTERLSVYLLNKDGKWLIANVKGPGPELTLRSQIGKMLMDSRLR